MINLILFKAIRTLANPALHQTTWYHLTTLVSQLALLVCGEGIMILLARPALFLVRLV